MFYVGLHQPSDAKHFERAFVSVNRLRTRKAPVKAREWIMDSGAFTEIATHGRYRHGVEEYAAEINRWAYPGSGLVAAVAQDYMCEPWIVAKTGLSVVEHQRLTIERYDALLPLVHGVYVMPVLQGYTVADYLRHIDQYGRRLAPGAYVGVGSVCKRNVNVGEIEAILCAIKRKRPDLRLHGFGLKITALGSGLVRDALHSADSMAWSYSARKQGRNANDWREALQFVDRIGRQPVQMGWDFEIQQADEPPPDSGPAMVPGRSMQARGPCELASGSATPAHGSTAICPTQLRRGDPPPFSRGLGCYDR